MKSYESESRSVMSNSLESYGLYSPWNSPGQNTGVGSLSLLQGIFPTQGSNPGLPHCRQILYHLSHKGRPSQHIFSHYMVAWNWVLHACVLSCLVVSDSLQHHELQPTRLLCPWDFPGKNLEWVAISSFSRSSHMRDGIRVSYVTSIGRQILYHLANWEASKSCLG